MEEIAKKFEMENFLCSNYVRLFAILYEGDWYLEDGHDDLEGEECLEEREAGGRVVVCLLVPAQHDTALY